MGVGSGKWKFPLTRDSEDFQLLQCMKCQVLYLPSTLG